MECKNKDFSVVVVGLQFGFSGGDSAWLGFGLGFDFPDTVSCR